MKRNWTGIRLTVMLILAACLAMALGCAAADGESADLPAEISTDLTKAVEDGYVLTDWERVPGENWLFAVMQKDTGKNVLYVYRLKNDGAWKRWLRTENVVPQGTKKVVLTADAKGSVHQLASETQSVKYPVISIQQLNDTGEYTERWIEFCLYKGEWLLTWWEDFDYCAVRVKSDEVRYYDTWQEGYRFQGRVQGGLQRDLRYAGISQIPHSLKAARQGVTTAPDIPGGTLKAEQIKFTGGKKYEVYSGPGENYLRGANGKAVVSTNDWLQVFGRENGWIMIQYAIDKDHMRIGWIPESALPKDAYTETLWLEAIPARVTARSVVTDDPLFSCATLKTAEEGTEVTWLATMGDWAYVEIAGEQPARGFILLKNVQILEEADEKG